MAFKAKHKKLDKKDTTGDFSFLHGVYEGEVKDAQIATSDKTGSVSLRFVIDVDGTSIYGFECFVSGDKKGNKTYYTTRSGKDVPLPGFVIADELCLATVGKGIMDSEKLFKKKTITIMKDGKKKKAKGLVLTKAIGKKVKIAVEHRVVDVTDNKYKPTGEFKEEHCVIKIFNKKGLTPLEVSMKSKPVFIKKITKSLQAKEPVDRTKGRAFTNGKGKEEKNKKKGKKSKKYDI